MARPKRSNPHSQQEQVAGGMIVPAPESPVVVGSDLNEQLVSNERDANMNLNEPRINTNVRRGLKRSTSTSLSNSTSFSVPTSKKKKSSTTTPTSVSYKPPQNFEEADMNSRGMMSGRGVARAHARAEEGSQDLESNYDSPSSSPSSDEMSAEEEEDDDEMDEEEIYLPPMKKSRKNKKSASATKTFGGRKRADGMGGRGGNGKGMGRARKNVEKKRVRSPQIQQQQQHPSSIPVSTPTPSPAAPQPVAPLYFSSSTSHSTLSFSLTSTSTTTYTAPQPSHSSLPSHPTSHLSNPHPLPLVHAYAALNAPLINQRNFEPIDVEQKLSEIKMGKGEKGEGLPGRVEMEEEVEEYLRGLNGKKKAKALITQEMYDTIIAILLAPTSTTHGNAQFRFWAKQMFELNVYQPPNSPSTSTATNGMGYMPPPPTVPSHHSSSIPVASTSYSHAHSLPHYHSNVHNMHQPPSPPPPPPTYFLTRPHSEVPTPVATRSQIYAILVLAHLDADHGGRDKTHEKVKENWIWVPKELVGRFVKRCHVCSQKKGNGGGGGGYSGMGIRKGKGKSKKEEDEEEDYEVASGSGGSGGGGEPPMRFGDYVTFDDAPGPSSSASHHHEYQPPFERYSLPDLPPTSDAPEIATEAEDEPANEPSSAPSAQNLGPQSSYDPLSMLVPLLEDELHYLTSNSNSNSNSSGSGSSPSASEEYDETRPESPVHFPQDGYDNVLSYGRGGTTNSSMNLNALASAAGTAGGRVEERGAYEFGYRPEVPSSRFGQIGEEDGTGRASEEHGTVTEGTSRLIKTGEASGDGFRFGASGVKGVAQSNVNGNLNDGQGSSKSQGGYQADPALLNEVMALYKAKAN